MHTDVPRGRSALLASLSLAMMIWTCAPAAAHAAGTAMYTVNLSTSSVTGEKPQSKLWYHDGSWWAILRGPDGVAFYEKSGDAWYRGAFVDAVLGSTGTADVKWDGTRLLVLLYNSSTKYFEYTYDSALRVWNLVPGFPVSVPHPSGAETTVLDEDSTGRAWITAEGGNNINVYYSTSADRRTWSKSPLVLRSGVDSDDIAAVIAFGGDKIGVFWSDQKRDEFGFCIHRDADEPTVWQPLEIASAGVHHADDHLHVAADAQGRVYAITKDDYDRMTVERRETDGTWTVRSDVTGAIGTRGVLVLAEADDKAYILWTDWNASPDKIAYRSASLQDLQFGSSTVLMSASAGLNNVTTTKQSLPPGCLAAVAEGAGQVWWNGWGAPVDPSLPPPGAPADLIAALDDSLVRTQLTWSAPAGGTADGYIVYRQQDGGTLLRLTAALWPDTTYVDSTLTAGAYCYKVTAFAHHQEGAASPTACVTYVPPPPPAPDPPPALLATGGELPLVDGTAAYLMDEATGQSLADATGHAHAGQLGTQPTADTSDPAWTAGLSSTGLRFDNSNDRVRIADAPDLRQAGSFTIEAWIRRAHTGSEDCVIAKGESGRRNYWLQLDTANRIDFRWQTSGGKDHGTQSTTTLTDLGWHHVACVYDRTAGENRIYLDGALVQRSADSGVPVTSTDPLYIGAKTTGGSVKSVFDGTIDGVRIASGTLYTADFTPAPDFSLSPHPVMQLAWQPPASGTVAGYHIYGQAADSSFARLDAALVTATTWVDVFPPSGIVCYRVTAVDALGQESVPTEPACAGGMAAKAAFASTASAPAAATPLSVGPNPFNPVTTIRFSLASQSSVSLEVFDVAGRRIAELLTGPQAPGAHEVRWEASPHVASGTYFLVLRSSEGVERRKLVLLK